MRMYGKRFLKHSMADAAGARVETRDAIIMDIDYTNSNCRVKIQGSDEYIVAQFPSSSRHAPEWLKPSAAVRVCHRGGVRGRVEVISAGQTVPTGNHTAPPQEILPEDCILSGCEIRLPLAHRGAFGAGKSVFWVTRGTYRFNGSVYQTKPIKCRKENPIRLLNAPKIGAIAEQFLIALPSAGKFAYYRVALQKITGEIVLRTSGDAIAPVLPEIPAGYLDCGWLFLRGGESNIDESAINGLYQPPQPCYFSVEGPVLLSAAQTSARYIIRVYDQFAQDAPNGEGEWSADIVITEGTGFVGVSADLIQERTIRIYGGIGETELVFWYQRNNATIEKSPKLTITLNEMSGVVSEKKFTLLDASGRPL